MALGCSSSTSTAFLHAMGLFEYAVGTVTGFGLLAVATFGGAVDTVELDDSPEHFVLAAIHYLSSLVPIGLTHLLLGAAAGKAVTLFPAGAIVSVSSNLFAALEEVISERVWRLEPRYGLNG